MPLTSYPASVSALVRSASEMSVPARVATATSLFSRLTTTSSVAGFLRNVFSMPCAQKAQTRPYTFISMVSATAPPLRSRIEHSNIRFMSLTPNSKIDHGHGLELAVVRDAGFDPAAALEQPQQQRPFRSVVYFAAVPPRLYHHPGGQRLVVMLVWRLAQLQRVDAVREIRGTV